ncbi:hypothetical protein [Thiothrix unzii]|jgi:hypothetical protein|uniref:hypothetical protein n=1 Tax=Thiothrix unzii TaxID=111769 RepID=UPI002A3665B9|nr:hypothetical protein [Thiothrix unzii]MDX9987448.1 hypothetical protein [Thiothrix unzii]
MKPSSYHAPGIKRVGRDGFYDNCCAACKGFSKYDKRCMAHDFVTAKGARCDDYRDLLDSHDQHAQTESELRNEAVATFSGRTGFESVAALCELRDQVLMEFAQMEQEPLPERYFAVMPDDLAMVVERLTDWLNAQRQWIALEEGEQRLVRWQVMLNSILNWSVSERLLIFPMLRRQWEQLQVSRTLLGHWFEVNGLRIDAVEIISMLPLVGSADGEMYDLRIEQLGECLTA